MSRFVAPRGMRVTTLYPTTATAALVTLEAYTLHIGCLISGNSNGQRDAEGRDALL